MFNDFSFMSSGRIEPTPVQNKSLKYNKFFKLKKKKLSKIYDIDLSSDS